MTNEQAFNHRRGGAVPPRPAHLRHTAEQLRAQLEAKTSDERRQLAELAENTYHARILATWTDEHQRQISEPLDPTDEVMVDTWLAGRHRDMDADPASARHLGAGLAAIQPHLPPTKFDNVTDLLDWLSAVPMVRLTHRHQLRLLAFDAEILELACTRAIDEAIACALDRVLVRDLVHDRPRYLDRAGDHALDLVRDLNRALILAGERISSLDNAIARDLDPSRRTIKGDRRLHRDLGNALDRVRALDNNLAHAVVGGLVGVRDQAYERVLYLARDLHLVHVVAGDLCRARDFSRARDVAHAVVGGLVGVRNQAYELVQMLCGMWVHLEVGDLLCGINDLTSVDTSWLDPATLGRQETERLNKLAADFTGVDLGEASLSGLDLTGVRWSKTTRWPMADVDWIVAASEPVGSGVYVIKESSAGDGVMVASDPVSV
jgi:hypothetical protein